MTPDERFIAALLGLNSVTCQHRLIDKYGTITDCGTCWECRSYQEREPPTAGTALKIPFRTRIAESINFHQYLPKENTISMEDGDFDHTANAREERQLAAVAKFTARCQAWIDQCARSFTSKPRLVKHTTR